MMRYLLSLLLIIVSAEFFYSQHLPLFSQYMFNGLSINPGCTGSREVLSISGSSRQQWVGIDGSPKTQYLSAHTAFKNKTGLGAQIIKDKTGVTTSTSLQLMYSYIMNFNTSRLSIGISASAVFIKSKWEQVHTTLPGDDVFDKNFSDSYPNFGFGAYYYSEKYNFGLSAPYLLKNSASEINADSVKFKHLNTFLYGAAKYRLNSSLGLKPSFLMKLYPDYSAQMDLSCLISYNEVVSTGFSVRTEDAIVWILDLQLTHNIRLGYAHDFTFSALSSYSKGSHEIFILYEAGNRTNAKSVKFL